MAVAVPGKGPACTGTHLGGANVDREGRRVRGERARVPGPAWARGGRSVCAARSHGGAGRGRRTSRSPSVPVESEGARVLGGSQNTAPARVLTPAVGSDVHRVHRYFVEVRYKVGFRFFNNFFEP